MPLIVIILHFFSKSLKSAFSLKFRNQPIAWKVPIIAPVIIHTYILLLLLIIINIVVINIIIKIIIIVINIILINIIIIIITNDTVFDNYQ